MSTNDGLSWYAALHGWEVNLDCGIQAVYMYFNGTGIRGCVNIIMIHWVRKFSIRKKLIEKNKKRANLDVTGAVLSNYTRTPSWWKYLLPSISLKKCPFISRVNYGHYKERLHYTSVLVANYVFLCDRVM